MVKTWFDIDGNEPAVAIYTGEDDAPMYSPESYIGTRTKFSTKFEYIPFVPAKKLGPTTINPPDSLAVADGSLMRRVINLGVHGIDGIPFIYGFVTVGSQVRPLCGSVPIYVNTTWGSGIFFTLVVDSTNVSIVELRDYPNMSGASAVSVTVYVSDKIVFGDDPEPAADYVDITENYMVAGDYDSRKRCLKQGVGNDLAVCSGATLSRGGTGILSGENACAWRWSMGSRGSVSFQPSPLTAPAPSPVQVTDCKI